MPDFLKRHSTWPHLEFKFKDAGVPIDCSIYTIRLVVRDSQGTIVINCIIGEAGSNAVWDDESTGIGHYEWQETDTHEVGTFQYEFKFVSVEHPEHKFPVPAKTFYSYEIIEDIELPPEEPVVP